MSQDNLEAIAQLVEVGLLKGAILLLTACAVSASLRRSAPAARHWMWTLTLVGLLPLTLLIWIGPAIQLPILPGSSTDQGQEITATNNRPVQNIGPQSTRPSAVETSSFGSMPNNSASPLPPNLPARFPWGSLVVTTIWLVGLLALALRWLYQTYRLRAIVHEAIHLIDADWMALTRQICDTLDIKQQPHLATSEQIAVPLTWGIWRPVILLPTAAAEWSSVRRRIVLLHEMAHVARGDCLTQTLALAACILHWPNPLTWYAVGQLNLECEQATDDVVLATGVRAAHYADQLLAVATAAVHADSLNALGLALGSQLERRIKRMLLRKGQAHPLTRARSLMMLLLASVLVLPLGTASVTKMSDTRTVGTASAFVSLHVGIIAGHSGIADDGPTKGEVDPGAVCPDGFSEGAVTLQVATEVVNRLISQGIRADLLEEFDPRLDNFQGTALIALHADLCDTDPVSVRRSGFEVGYSDRGGKLLVDEQRLQTCLQQHYTTETGLALWPIPAQNNLPHYHAFSRIAATTPGVVVELGHLYYDRDLLQNHTDKVAEGIVNGVQCYISSDSQSTQAPSTTTLDKIQQLAKVELRLAVQQSDAAGGNIIIMDPTTGQILALTSLPTQTDVGSSADPAVSTVYEPGSAFDIVTGALALQSGEVSQDWMYQDMSPYFVGGRSIYNWDRAAHGSQTFSDIFIHSWNIGVAHLSVEVLGPRTFYSGLQRFGVGMSSGVNLPGEATGILQTPVDSYWQDSNLALNSFGQGLTVTPLQMLLFTNALAANGRIMQPYLAGPGVLSSGQGKIILYQPVSPEAAQAMTATLVKVVDEGIGRPAKVPGYAVAGMPGTAQLPCPSCGGGYDPTVQEGTFVGFFPAAAPRVSILIKLDHVTSDGSRTAAPVFSRLAKQLAVLMDIPPAPTTQSRER